MDVKVYGMVVGTHLLEDIQMDVPFQCTVVIPAEKANRSKDLWRAISQKLLLQLNSGMNLGGPPAPLPIADPTLKDRIATLEKEKVQLEKENRELRSQLEANQARLNARPETEDQSAKLDKILGLLASGIPMGTQPGLLPKVSDVVADDVPTFIPSSITPENVEARIEAASTEAESPGVSGAAKTLRELRQKNRQ